LDAMNDEVVGVFIAPTTKLAVWWRLLSNGAPDSPVRHWTLSGARSHVTWPLGFDRWSSDRWGLLAVRWCTGQVL
jgi:hypothetical protein